jgi:hypothetical protein
VIRAHQQAEEWKKGGEGEEKLGRCGGGFSPKIHIRGGSKGKPITFLLSPGQRNESIFLEQLIELLRSKRVLVQVVRLYPLKEW